MDTRAAEILRDHLQSIKGWIEHWQRDAECRLPCTPDSLEMAHWRAEAALKLIAAIRQPTRPDPIVPGESVGPSVEA